MLKGGVIMDVTTPEEARIAEEAGAVAVMALERVPADIRRDGGVARMSDPSVITAIKAAVTIPVMAKARIGHFVEAQILESLGVDYVDESEVRQEGSKDDGWTGGGGEVSFRTDGNGETGGGGSKTQRTRPPPSPFSPHRSSPLPPTPDPPTHARSSPPRTTSTTSTSTTSACPSCAGAGTWARPFAAWRRARP